MESDEINDKYLDVFHNQYIQDTIVKSVSIRRMAICTNSRFTVNFTDHPQKEEIKNLDGDVRSKETVLEENAVKLERFDKELVEIDHNQENLIIQRTELEYEAIKMKKQS